MENFRGGLPKDVVTGRCRKNNGYCSMQLTEPCTQRRCPLLFSPLYLKCRCTENKKKQTGVNLNVIAKQENTRQERQIIKHQRERRRKDFTLTHNTN